MLLESGASKNRSRCLAGARANAAAGAPAEAPLPSTPRPQVLLGELASHASVGPSNPRQHHCVCARGRAPGAWTGPAGLVSSQVPMPPRHLVPCWLFAGEESEVIEGNAPAPCPSCKEARWV